MPLSAGILLQPESTEKPGWAVFDAEWYNKTYGLEARNDAALLDYYLNSGCLVGHSPSPLFDEIYYLSANPQVSALIKAGRFTSGFDYYCQIGHRFHSGHWLFDDGFYDCLYGDMSLQNLDANRYYGRYDHYLRTGQYEHRQGHVLFDSRAFVARAVAAGDDARLLEQLGPYRHFLYRLQSDAAELPPSIYFDPAWYVEQREHARSGIAGMQPGSAIAHYLQAVSTGDLDPVPEFSEYFYRHANPDVLAALDCGDCTSGYQHFLQTGVFELRRPSPEIDLLYYRDANAEVRNALNTGIARDAFAHLRSIGLAAGLPSAPPPPGLGMTEAAARQLFIRRAEVNLVVFARQKLDFTPKGECALAVIMVAFEKFELTMMALASLRGNFAGDIQLILVDNGSTDATLDIGHFVGGAHIIRLDKNTGHPQACNLALSQVTAKLVLFLDCDSELVFGAVEAAIARIRSAPDIGAVGGKIIRSNGLLQEAGGIIRRDGSHDFYMEDASPLAGEVNFVREVDFCSGVFLLCRTAAVKALGGFDADFSPGQYDDVDLCLRLGAAGLRIVYEPAAVIHRLQFGGGRATQVLLRRGRQILAGKHAAYLQRRLVSTSQQVAARSPDRGQRNILFIEDTVPLRRLGAGYVRANDIVHAIAGAGYGVTVFPVSGVADDKISVYSDLPDCVEVMQDCEIGQLGAFLRDRCGYYDLIWVSRTHNLAAVLPICLAEGIDPERVPFVLDTEAISTVREEARARLGGEDFNFDMRLQDELEIAQFCRHCIAVNEVEAGLLRRVGLNAVSVLGTMRRCDATANGFSARAGLLFVGSIHQQDSPNLDALFWYLEQILPVLSEEIAEVPVLNFAGYVAPGIDLTAFAGNPLIKIHGAAVSLRQHYERNRVFIAPTRYAAGTPYKIYEAASFGVPIVGTDLLAGQLGWQDGLELLTARVGDAKSFAAQIARVYYAPGVWAELRANALARVAGENTAEVFDGNVAAVLDSVFAMTGKKGVDTRLRRA